MFKNQRAKQERLATAWNEQHRVGTEVDYFYVRKPGVEPTRHKTRSSAYLMGGHTACVDLEGRRGGVALESLDAVAVETKS